MNDPEPAPVQVIRHVGFEDLGTLAGELGRVGLAFDYLDPPRHELAVAGNAQLLIVLGGPISVNDADRFSFLQDEIELVRHRIDNRLPTLGICLGAQLIAKAMGAAVVPMAEPEIGWGRLDLTDAGKASPLRHLAGSRSGIGRTVLDGPNRRVFGGRSFVLRTAGLARQACRSSVTTRRMSRAARAAGDRGGSPPTAGRPRGGPHRRR